MRRAGFYPSTRGNEMGANFFTSFISQASQILDGIIPLTKLVSGTQGNIIYFNGTNWVSLAPGTAGQRLQTNGVGANPSWTSLPAAGKGYFGRGIVVPTGATVPALSDYTLFDVAHAGFATNKYQINFFHRALGGTANAYFRFRLFKGGNLLFDSDAPSNTVSNEILMVAYNGASILGHQYIQHGTGNSNRNLTSLTARDLSVSGNLKLTLYNTSASAQYTPVSNWQQYLQIWEGD